MTTVKTATQDWVHALFSREGALLEGHFALSSGRHSDRYLQCALLLQRPDVAEEFGARIAELFRDTAVEKVVSPAIGGIVIGHEVGRALGAPAIFTEKDADGKTVIRRGFAIEPGESVLVIEDVLTTGLSSAEVMNKVAEAGGTVIGLGCIVDRREGAEPVSGAEQDFVPRALMSVPMRSWAADDCELCRRNVPLEKPGSRKS